MKPEIGFAYLQPRWGRGLRAAVNPEDLDYGVVFYPRFDVEVHYYPSGYSGTPRTFVVSASYLRLEGDIARQSTRTGGAGRVEADSELELITADVVGMKWLPRHPDAREDKCWLEGVIAIRYASTDQRFTSRVTGDSTVVADLHSTQQFSGVGVSTAAGLRVPVIQPKGKEGKSPLKLYSNVRGSLLIGNNGKTSTFQAAGAQTVTIQEDERDVIPVGELELGLALGDVPLPLARVYGYEDQRPMVVGIKAAAVGQIWGDLGYISAARPPLNRFDSGNLYLYGAIVTFYLER